LINQAGDQLSSANYQEAIEYYNQAILLKPDDKGAYISAYINRGYAHSQLKDYQRAVEDYIFIIIEKQIILLILGSSSGTNRL
jgi:tetratricopeptide (TPR) repeat protein